jgi:serine acetyltransferase
MAQRETANSYRHPQALVETEDIGPNTRIWAFAHVMRGAQIGANCNLGDHTFIESGVKLGNNVTVKNGVSLWTGITIENDVFLGPNCVFTNDPNPRAYLKKGEIELLPTLVRLGATIGANATILCGINIGKHAFVGAGAVILHSVPDFALVVGNPGHHIGWMCICANKLPLLPGVPFEASCACTQCGKSYTRAQEGLTLKRTL